MKDEQTVERILKYITKILDYTKGTEYDDFINNSMLVEACVFNLSQIGELAKEFQEKHPFIPWRIMYGLRNKIVHDYEGVNLVLIWDIVKEDLPDLNTQLEELSQNILNK